MTMIRLSISISTVLLCIVLVLSIPQAHGFSTQPLQQTSCRHPGFPILQHTHSIQQQRDFIQQYNRKQHGVRQSSTSLSVIGAGAASILAGSVGGAIGVGIAYPLDTLKTKSQVYGQQAAQQRKEMEQRQNQSAPKSSSAAAAMERDADGHVPLPPPGTVGTLDHNFTIESPEENLISLVKLILANEGIPGFYGGVKAMMVGQALIKSVAFSANAMALGSIPPLLVSAGLVESMDSLGPNSFVTLLLAAAFSGFVTSFLVAPVERVKVMMQAQSDSTYANELECIQAVLENEGWTGLFSRGLGPTLAREVPSYAIYFVVYGILIQTAYIGSDSLGSIAPLVCGAISGMACWVPVYPVDVVKTLVQNTEGGDPDSAIDIAVQLYNDEGIGAFFNGLTPKMLRASVNHAVTFWVYALMMDALT